MKKTNLIRVIALIMALCLTSVIFVGCNKDDTSAETSAQATENSEATPAESQNVKGYCKVVLGDENKTEYEIDLDLVNINNGLLSVLDHLKETKGLTYSCDASGFLTDVGNVKQDTAAGVYIYLYTSVVKDQDVSQYATTMKYNDLTLISTGVGTKDMTIEKDAIIYIGTISWS